MEEKINNLNNNVLQFDHNEWFLDDKRLEIETNIKVDKNMN